MIQINANKLSLSLTLFILAEYTDAGSSCWRNNAGILYITNEFIKYYRNSENLWEFLTAGKNYLIEVTVKSGQTNFAWDYSLAWNKASDMDGDGIANATDAFPLGQQEP